MRHPRAVKTDVEILLEEVRQKHAFWRERHRLNPTRESAAVLDELAQMAKTLVADRESPQR